MMERTLQRDYYLSEKIFQLEQERIFYREWFCAGREEDLAQPGIIECSMYRARASWSAGWRSRWRAWALLPPA
jgi:phenylpropionate dioxygenase-like ring-hydroxylating dioxygenase large terminal subunit